MTTQQSTALAVREQSTTVYDPRDLAEARSLALEFAASRLFSAKGKEQALAVMGAGAELGLSPLASLRMIYVADFGQGPQISISADAMRAACLRRRDVCEFFRTTESTATSCTVEVKRVGDPPRRATWTIDRAKAAKLGQVKEGKDAGSTNWAKYPEQMLRHRCDAELAREVFPDILGGMYTADELQEAAREAPRDVTPPDVRPLPTVAPKPAPAVVDAVIIESDDERAERIEQALAAITTEPERAAVMAAENGKAPLARMPKGAARERIAAANTDAKKRIAAAATQAVLDQGAPVVEAAGREVGEEG